MLGERNANQKALRTARARFNPPPTPAELTVTYRGPFGPIEVDVDGEELREMLSDFSPRSRRGRRLRRLLHIYDNHRTRVWADREASGLAAAMEERNRIHGELEAAAKAACGLGGLGVADVALQAATLIAAKPDSYQDCRRAAAIVQALLEVAALH